MIEWVIHWNATNVVAGHAQSLAGTVAGEEGHVHVPTVLVIDVLLAAADLANEVAE
jgi:hypothetical protein